jgi:ribosomal protein S18 acetylase RimI-like enzyme
MDTSPFTVRRARPHDVPAIYLLKWHFALAEGSTHTVRASEADWLRDMFGPHPQFWAVVAETAGAVIGMATLVERFAPGWVGPLLAVNDVFVLPDHRRHGVATALLAATAADAIGRGVPFVELTVRGDNPARRLYRKAGFERVRDVETYVLAGAALAALAAGGHERAGSSQAASQVAAKSV